MSAPAWRRTVRRICVLPIVVYQRWISPWTPATCRFRPTCSAYVHEAVLTHGLVRGGWLGVRRVARCHPFSAPGPDPVPPPNSERAATSEASDEAAIEPSEGP